MKNVIIVIISSSNYRVIKSLGMKHLEILYHEWGDDDVEITEE